MAIELEAHECRVPPGSWLHDLAPIRDARLPRAVKTAGVDLGVFLPGLEGTDGVTRPGLLLLLPLEVSLQDGERSPVVTGIDLRPAVAPLAAEGALRVDEASFGALVRPLQPHSLGALRSFCMCFMRVPVWWGLP